MKRIPLSPQALIAALLIVSTLVRLVLAGTLNLVVDEAYLLAVTRQFQLSWYDHPPLAFWIVWALQALFGPDLPPILLRLPFVLLFTGSTWLLYELTARLYSEKAGIWAALAFTLAPFFLVSAGSWLVPDGPLTFFVLLSANLLARLLFVERPGPRWGLWLALGFAAGLAMLSKYHAVLFLAGAGAYLIFSPAHRHWLARGQPWVALALALLMFTPVLIWNAANDWISFAFQIGRAGGVLAVDPLRLLVALAGEGLYLLPWTLGGLAAGLIIALRKGLESQEKFLFLAALALPAILLFNFLALAGQTVLFHWPMSG
ncbi:MAG: glycosyltransferase family 39 protein, partial [Cucumibacter sp.]